MLPPPSVAPIRLPSSSSSTPAKGFAPSALLPPASVALNECKTRKFAPLSLIRYTTPVPAAPPDNAVEYRPPSQPVVKQLKNDSRWDAFWTPLRQSVKLPE